MSGNKQQFFQLKNKRRRYFWSRNLRQRQNYCFLFLCQHKDSLGLIHCNSNLPAVMQGDVCVTEQNPENINTTLAFLQLVSTLQALCEVYRQLSTCLFTYLLTPWSRVLLVKLTGFQLVKKFPAF